MIDESIIGMIAMVHVYKSVKGDNDQPGASVYKRLKRGMMIIMVQVYKSDDDGYYTLVLVGVRVTMINLVQVCKR